MKHPHKISMALTDDEFSAIVRYAGLDESRRSIWCREAIMELLAHKEAELNSKALAAGYRLVPIEASEVSEV